MKKYKIRFLNSKGKEVTLLISNEQDLNKITKSVAKNSKIECKISDNMPVELHNAIAEHNKKLNK